MKIYNVILDMNGVLPRLKKFRLKEFNDNFPNILIEAEDPDDACYSVYCKLSETLLKQEESVETAKLIKEISEQIRITKVYCKDEERL